MFLRMFIIDLGTRQSAMQGVLTLFNVNPLQIFFLGSKHKNKENTHIRIGKGFIQESKTRNQTMKEKEKRLKKERKEKKEARKKKAGKPLCITTTAVRDFNNPLSLLS